MASAFTGINIIALLEDSGGGGGPNLRDFNVQHCPVDLRKEDDWMYSRSTYKH